jgi:hypothetical protein
MNDSRGRPSFNSCRLAKFASTPAIALCFRELMPSYYDFPMSFSKQIVYLAATPDAHQSYDSLAEYHRAVPLSLVCQRFYKISVTILYRGIQASSGTDDMAFIPPGASVRALHRSLSEHPALRFHCRKLVVYRRWRHKGWMGPSWCIINDITSWLTKITDLTLYGGFENDNGNWQWLARAAEHMPDIQKISLWRQELVGLQFKPILDLPTYPKLRDLTLHGISRSASRSTDFICPKVRWEYC